MENQFQRTDQEFSSRNSINKKRKGKGGRPKLPLEQTRSWVFRIGLTDAEFYKVEKLATEVGLTECEFIRRAALNLQINSISQLNKDCLVQLNRIGNNINQIARTCHTNPDHLLIAESVALMQNQISALAKRIGSSS